MCAACGAPRRSGCTARARGRAGPASSSRVEWEMIRDVTQGRMNARPERDRRVAEWLHTASLTNLLSMSGGLVLLLWPFVWVGTRLRIACRRLLARL